LFRKHFTLRCTSLVRTAVILAPALAYAAPPNSAASLPEGPGKATVARLCVGCHGTSTITRTRRTKAQWENVVGSMADRGCALSDSERATVVRYLNVALGAQGSGKATSNAQSKK
jgi:hypothetical protein